MLYARTDIGGAYRWNDTSKSWTPITDGPGFSGPESRFHGIESIALDPNNDQLVYMMTGMYTFEGNGRIYISSDRGTTWTHYDVPFAMGGNNGGRPLGERLMVDPNKPSTLFFGSRVAGLWKSTDTGKTWAQVPSLSSVTMTSAQIKDGGIGAIAGDWNTYGRIYFSGTGRGLIYTNQGRLGTKGQPRLPFFCALSMGDRLSKRVNDAEQWSSHEPRTVRRLP